MEEKERLKQERDAHKAEKLRGKEQKNRRLTIGE